MLYHKSCLDGFGAAWAAWKRLGDDADYIPVQYGQQVPDLGNVKRLTIVDFAYPRTTLEELAKTMHVTVLDHHKTWEEELKGLPFATFDMNHSGAILSWNYFHPNTPPPKLLLHVEDRDIWKWELAGSKEITAALDVYPFQFDTWDMLTNCLDQLAMEGATLLRYRARLVDQAMKPIWADVAGYWVPVVNTTVLQSEVGNQLCKENPDAKFSASYFDSLVDGHRVWSLRSVGDFDVSEVAKSMGGGGHRNAAGFRTPVPGLFVSPDVRPL